MSDLRRVYVSHHGDPAAHGMTRTGHGMARSGTSFATPLIAKVISEQTSDDDLRKLLKELLGETAKKPEEKRKRRPSRKRRERRRASRARRAQLQTAQLTAELQADPPELEGPRQFGDGALVVIGWFCSPKTLERVFLQVAADVQRDLSEAKTAGASAGECLRIRALGFCSLARTVAWQALWGAVGALASLLRGKTS